MEEMEIPGYRDDLAGHIQVVVVVPTHLQGGQRQESRGQAAAQIWRTRCSVCIGAEQKGGCLAVEPLGWEADRERAAMQSALHSRQGTGKTCPTVT